MHESRMVYFEKDDVLHVALKEGEEARCVEITPEITAELDERGELIGIEILGASRFIRDIVVDSVQAKIMGLTATPSISVAEEQSSYGSVESSG